ncbi:MAG TPA: hypothetical protein VG983_02080, partial [Caulobacterales bacterium]|nr:hypothetical protein [Caulobacterales bacterium]
MIDESAYFLDWRPVTSIPACNPPNCSDLKILDRETLLKQRGVAEPEDHELVRRAFACAKWRWRDDGLVIFAIALDRGFVAAARAHFDPDRNAPPADAALDAMIEEIVGRLWKAEDRNFEGLLRIVLRSLSGFVSTYVKDETFHEHAFDGRPNAEASARRLARAKKNRVNAKPNPSSSLSHIFLRIGPMRLSWPCADFEVARPQRGASRLARAQYRSVKALLAAPQTTPLDLLPFDAALVALRRQRATGDAARPALFELRRVYSGLVDDCLRVLPLVKKLTLFGHADGKTLTWVMALFSAFTIGCLLGLLSWPPARSSGGISAVLTIAEAFTYEIAAIVMAAAVLYNVFLPDTFEIEWPATGIVYACFAAASVAAIAFSFWLVTRAALFQDIRVMFWAGLLPFLLCALVYSGVETWFRRNAVVQAIVRTAGVLEFGALLASVVGHAAFNAGQHRGPEPITHDQSAAIIAHKLELEQHKRQMAMEVLTFILGVIAAALAVLQILVPLF